MNQKLSHILDSSVCVTGKQLKAYVGGAMTSEECHAVEHHVNSCAFCSDALDGALRSPAETLVAAADFNGNFLKAQFSLNDPQIHMNSMGPAINGKRNKISLQPFWLKTSVAAAVIIGAVVILFLQAGKPAGPLSLKHFTTHKVTQNVPAQSNTDVASK